MSTMGAVSLWRPVGAGDQPSSSSAGAAGPVRLTRRGRVLVALVALVAVAWLVVLVIARAGAGSADGVDAGEAGRVVGDGAALPVAAALATVTVRDGDSLWAIAERSAPGSDTHEVVAQIRNVNGLGSSLIQPGQVLLVPAGH